MSANTPPTTKIFGFVFILLWMTIGTALYAYGHRPFGPEFALKILTNFWSIGVSLWLLALAGALGRRALARFELPDVGKESLQAIIGVGISSTVIFIWGSALFINSLILWIFLLVATFFLWRDMAAWSKNSLAGWRSLWNGSTYVRIIFSGTTGLLIFALLKSLAPPLAYDAQVYHLVLPLRHLAAGQILIYDDLLFSGFPQMLHMQYLWLFGLGVQTPAVFGWWIGVMGLSSIWMIGKTWFSDNAAATAIAALFTSYTLIEALSTAYVDWAGIWVGAGALLLFVEWKARKRGSDLILLGVLAGISVAFKYTFGILLLILLAGVAWENRKTIKQMVWQVFQVGIGATLTIAPWLLKNWLSTGNPVYPLLFPAGAMTAERVALYNTNSVFLPWYEIVFLPFRATFWGIHNGTLGDAPNFQGEVGPLLLLLGLLAFLGNRNRDGESKRIIQGTAFFGIVGLVLWAAASTFADYLIFPRHYYVILPPFALLAAFGFSVTEDYNVFDVRLQRLVMALVVLSFGFTSIKYSLNAIEDESLQIALGVKSEEDYLLDQLGLQMLVSQRIKDNYDEGEVLLLWETRSYYCLPACIPDDNANRWIYTWREQGDIDAIVAMWQAEGIKYIVVRQGALDFVWSEAEQARKEELIALRQFTDGLTIVEDFNGSYILYQLDD